MICFSCKHSVESHSEFNCGDDQCCSGCWGDDFKTGCECMIMKKEILAYWERYNKRKAASDAGALAELKRNVMAT